VGSSLEKVLEVIGKPTKTVEGKQGVKNWDDLEDSVLYKNINGEKGYCHYRRPGQGISFDFKDNKVILMLMSYSVNESAR